MHYQIPVFDLRAKEGGSRLGTFNFFDALNHYGSGLTEV
jgi:hypothetical protein